MSVLGWLITRSVQWMNADSLRFLIPEFSSVTLHNFFFFISGLIIGSHIGLMSMLGWLITWSVQWMNGERGFFEFPDP